MFRARTVDVEDSRVGPGFRHDAKIDSIESKRGANLPVVAGVVRKEK